MPKTQKEKIENALEDKVNATLPIEQQVELVAKFMARNAMDQEAADLRTLDPKKIDHLFRFPELTLVFSGYNQAMYRIYKHYCGKVSVQ